MRSQVILFSVVLACVWAHATPLLHLIQPRTDPTRMTMHNGSVFLPHFYTKGGETGYTICWWVRWECPAYEKKVDSNAVIPALTFQGMNSLVPAKPTTQGGASLKSFYRNESVQFDSNASFGIANIIPESPECFPTDNYPNRFVVCCNVRTDADLTLTIGGSEKFVASTTNELHIFNIECYKGDRSIAITASRADAKVAVALAINPPIKFFTTHNHQCHMHEVQATNTFSFACLRIRLEDGKYRSNFNLFDLLGNVSTHSFEYDVEVDCFAKDSLFQLSQFTIYGRTDECVDGSPRQVDIYGLKAIPYALSDEQMWRIYDVDLAEIKARGLTNALPHKR